MAVIPTINTSDPRVKSSLVVSIALDLDRAEFGPVPDPTLQPSALVSDGYVTEDIDGGPAHWSLRDYVCPPRFNYAHPLIAAYLEAKGDALDSAPLPTLTLRQAKAEYECASRRLSYLERRWLEGYGTLRRLCDARAWYRRAVTVHLARIDAERVARLNDPLYRMTKLAGRRKARRAAQRRKRTNQWSE